MSLEMVKLDTSNFVCWFIDRSASARMIYMYFPKGMCDVSRDLFQFCEISDNISLTVQDRDI